MLSSTFFFRVRDIFQFLNLFFGAPGVVASAHFAKVHAEFGRVLRQLGLDFLGDFCAWRSAKEQTSVVLLDGNLATPIHQHVVVSWHGYHTPMLYLGREWRVVLVPDDPGADQRGVGDGPDARRTSLGHAAVVRSGAVGDVVDPLLTASGLERRRSPSLVLAGKPIVTARIKVVKAAIQTSDCPPVSLNLLHGGEGLNRVLIGLGDTFAICRVI